MRVPTCSICGLIPQDVGPLCVTECAWEPGRPWFECKRCWAEGVMNRESLRAIQEDGEMDAEHFAKCSWCHNRRGLMPKLALQQQCAERRRSEEARRVA